MRFRKIISYFTLQYDDALEEQEYVHVKTPFINTFVVYLFLALTSVLIVYDIRYFIRDVSPQNYLIIALIVAAMFLVLIRKYLGKYIEHFLILYMILAIALFTTVYSDGLANDPQRRNTFYVGYIFAMIHRLIGYRIIRFRFLLLLYIASTALKFPQIHCPDALVNIMVVGLDYLTVGLGYQSEKVDRALFDSLYKSNKHIMKFKNLLTQYLPNQMAVFASDYSTAFYINNAFKRTFRCKKAAQVKDVLTKYTIERETIEKNRSVFNAIGFGPIPNEETVNLSQFMTLLAANADAMRDLGTISFPVVEEERLEPEAEAEAEASVRRRENLPPPPPHQLENSSKPPPHSGRHQMSAENARPELVDVPNLNFNESQGSNDKNSSSRSHSSDQVQYEEGRKRVFKVKIFPLLWDDTEAIAMVMDDITQQKIIMELKVADKNKDLVIATVSHELRTPLNGMLGLLDIINKNTETPENLSYIRACKNTGTLMLNLVNSILDLNQIKNKKLKLAFTKVPIRELMEEVKSLFDYDCSLRQLYLNVEIAPNVPKKVVTDRGRLTQILVNLLGNAFKFTFEGGVTIKVELESLDPYRIRFSVKDTGIGISKEDQERLFKMYGKIEQQDKKINTNGIGLGLTISNTLAILLNPTDGKPIEVDSEVRKGTCFSFLVQSQDKALENIDLDSISLTEISPIEDKEESDVTVVKKVSMYTMNNNENFSKMLGSSQDLDFKNSKISVFDRKDSNTNVLRGLKSMNTLILNPVSSSPPRTLRPIAEEESVNLLGGSSPNDGNRKGGSAKTKAWCLVVDDNPFNLMVASHLMKERGYSVKIALNGQDALEKAREHQNENKAFKVVLMDCQMPVMDGYQATKELREMMKSGVIQSYPIIALTANNRDEDHEKLCQEVGMSGHLAKPLQIHELEKMLKQVQKENK